MTTSPEIPTRTTGARQAHGEGGDRAAARTPAQRPSEQYDPYLDGLFTYCLSVLCDHDAATAALAHALRLAERRRGPGAPDDRRARLYALARWACLRALAESREKRQGAHASGRPGTDGQRAPHPTPPVPQEDRTRRQRDLARLAWPEAAGTTPEQREALELAVRHQLTADEVAAVLGTAAVSARALLASAACEVERTRAALAVVETGTCPGVARLTDDHRLFLSATLRRELVRHVDECPHCRRTAERAASGTWPGTSVTPAALPLVEAPRADLHAAMTGLPRARGGTPRFDRRGFPLHTKDRAARRDRLRARAVTTTVVATVVAAPVLALWAACRGDSPPGGTAADGPAAATAREAHDPDVTGAGGGATGRPDAGGPGAPGGEAEGRGAGGGSSHVSVKVHAVSGAGAGELAVRAAGDGDTTVLTLTATGGAPVAWSARTDAGWLYLSRSRGTLAPGATLTVKVYVDRLREPAGRWSAHVSLAPAGSVVSIEGYGPAPRPDTPRPAPPGPRPRPTAPSDD
uniref:BACON domain-containing protein n=1 Tax=Streptomyces sp. CRN 30 TaxID=3075613 RepID=UPI0039C12CEE